MKRIHQDRFAIILEIVTILIISGIFTPIVAVEKQQYKKRVAILDFTAENTTKTYANAARNLFEVSLHNAGTVEILERNQIDSLMNEFKFQMSGCIDTSCAVQIGKMLSVDYMIMGSVNRLGNSYTITIKVVDVKISKIHIADSETALSENEIKNSLSLVAGRISTRLSGMEEKTLVYMDQIPLSSEGDKSRDKSTDKKGKDSFIPGISISFIYDMPTDKFANLVNPGYSGIAFVGYEDVLYPNIRAGIEIGYSYFPGNIYNVKNCTMIPLSATFGYNIHISKVMFISPMIGFGAAYKTMTYNKDGHSSGESPNYRTESEFGGIGKTGIDIGYRFDRITALAGFYYNSIIEKSGRLDYMSYTISLGMNF